ncbi:Centromere protein Cenp-O [Penicillium sp. IBT 16267x]|nr:Centromere protein Cenp-O [Penicillium sp. IBT 16267x]
MNTRAHPSASPDPQAERLDTEIASIRAEIHSLQRQKRFLSSSLLASSNIQKLLRKPLTTIHDEISPLAQAAGKHSETNHYRIAFGTTAFPFKDPSPSAPAENLLGLRIDVCTRNGRFAKPYYVLLRRERVKDGKQKSLRVYRHTVPAFISIPKLASVYLPFNGSSAKTPGDVEEDEDESEDQGNSLKPAQKKKRVRSQDLRGFTRELRRELVAWHLRCDAVDLLRERLGFKESDSDSSSVGRYSPERKAGIVSLDSTAIETRYVRLEFEDGRVGRFKLSNAGVVERAVVIGDEGRDKQTETAMTRGGGRIESLVERLQELASPAQ